MSGEISTGNKYAEDAWTAATLQNSFTAHAAVPGYMKHPDGEVRLRGKVVKASPSADQVIFTLPAGYCPTQAINCPATGNVGSADVYGAVSIATNGDVAYRAGGASTYLSLDGITFRANL